MAQLELWWTQLIGGLRDTIQAIVTYVPVALTGVVVLITGWLLALVLRAVLRHAVRRYSVYRRVMN